MVDFHIFVDPTKTTSGQRFWLELADVLGADRREARVGQAAALMNVSAPIGAVWRARRSGKVVVLRVDGVYIDRLSKEFLARFAWPLRTFLRIWGERSFLGFVAADFANLLNRNYGVLARMLLAHFIIYQSEYSKTCYQRYFPKRPSAVIVNGAPWRRRPDARAPSGTGPIRLVTVHNTHLQSKQVGEIVRFVQWANEVKRVPLELTILGFDAHDLPKNFYPADVEILRTRPYVRTLPRFRGLTDDILDVIEGAHAYISFSFRDACPNVVIESMSCGIPVVGLASGGMPDIVGDAGILLPCDDFQFGFHAPHRYEDAFAKINYEEMMKAVETVAKANDEYRARVVRRHAELLAMSVVGRHYERAMALALGQKS